MLPPYFMPRFLISQIFPNYFFRFCWIVFQNIAHFLNEFVMSGICCDVAKLPDLPDLPRPLRRRGERTLLIRICGIILCVFHRSRSCSLSANWRKGGGGVRRDWGGVKLHLGQFIISIHRVLGDKLCDAWTFQQMNLPQRSAQLHQFPKGVGIFGIRHTRKVDL